MWFSVWLVLCDERNCVVFLFGKVVVVLETDPSGVFWKVERKHF